MVINLILAIILSLFFMVILPAFFLVLFYNKPSLKWITLAFSIIYFIMLFVGVFGKVDIDTQNISITFESNNSWFIASHFSWFSFDTINILLNLFMLFPLGAIVLASTKKHAFLKTVAFSFCTSLFIEFMQFALPINRTVEVTDLLYNTLSGIIGFLFFWLILKLFKKNNQKSYSEPE